MWDYKNPVYHDGIHSQGDFPFGNGVFKVHRYPLDYAGFTGRDLTPGAPLEGNPLPLINGCDGVVGRTEEDPPEQLKIYPNPAEVQVTVELPGPDAQTLKVYSLQGVLQLEREIKPGANPISVEDWPTGIYLFQCGTDEFTPANFEKRLIKVH